MKRNDKIFALVVSFVAACAFCAYALAMTIDPYYTQIELVYIFWFFAGFFGIISAAIIKDLLNDKKANKL